MSVKKSKMIKLITGCLIIGIFIVNGCRPVSGDKKEIKGTVSISGAFALYPMAVKWADEFRKLHPGIQIDVSAGGAGKGMADVLNGMVDLGMVSRAISQEEVSKGAWFIAVTRDAVLPVVNADNPEIDSLMARGLTRGKLIDIFITGNISDWKACFKGAKSNKINVFNRSDACGAGEMWAKYMGKKQDDIKGIGVFGDPGMADAVKADVMAIGYNNVIFVYDIKTRQPYEGLRIVPIDLNGNRIVDPSENVYQNLDSIMSAIQTGRYPSPPARDLYFVSKGKPREKAVAEFLKWILKEGQTFVREAGYVRLDNEKTVTELKKLD